MFPNQRTSNILFQNIDNNEGVQDVANNEEHQDKIWMNFDGGLDHEVGALNTSNNTRKGGRHRKSYGNINTSVGGGSNSSNNNRNVLLVDDEQQQRKNMHKETERQRRQEMSNLCASLRSILPSEYVKGKRATSDHLEQAVNYIKDLEKNVKELGDKRDQLKASIETTRSKYDEHGGGAGGSRTEGTPCPGTVVMLPSLGGVDIEINVGCENEAFTLSSALHVILDQGLGIASYTSTRVDDRLVHNIVCEVNDVAQIDIDGLHQRLIFLLY